jgi:bifunctional non-homologous end joining protein LigD
MISIRRRPRRSASAGCAPVTAPCTWEEVERGEVSPKSFTIRNMAERIANFGDLWADLLKTKRSLKLPMGRLDKML